MLPARRLDFKSDILILFEKLKSKSFSASLSIAVVNQVLLHVLKADEGVLLATRKGTQKKKMQLRANQKWMAFPVGFPPTGCGKSLVKKHEASSCCYLAVKKIWLVQCDRFLQSPSKSFFNKPRLSTHFLRAFHQVDAWNKSSGFGKRSGSGVPDHTHYYNLQPCFMVWLLMFKNAYCYCKIN